MRRSGVGLALVLFVAGLQVAQADDVTPDAGIRVGVAEKAHGGGRTDFVGNGMELGIAAGVRVGSLSLRLGYERGPQLTHLVAYQQSGDIAVRDIAIIAVAELDLDPFFVGVGGGWLHETTTEQYWYEDNLGPVGPAVIDYTRSGQLVLARGGVRLARASRLAANLVVQLTAQRVVGPIADVGPEVHEHAFGASVGLELRGPVAASAPHAIARALFVGPDLGLTGTMFEGAWSNAAPRAGLEVGGYLSSAFALVLGAAGSRHMTSAEYDDNHVRFTLGAEAHRETLYATLGAGLSRYTQKASDPQARIDQTYYSGLFYAGAGAELPGDHVRYRLGAELSRFDVRDGATAYALSLVLGIRLSSAP